MLLWALIILMVCAMVNVFSTVSCGFNGFPVKPRTTCEVAVLMLNVALCFALVIVLVMMGSSRGGFDGV